MNEESFRAVDQNLLPRIVNNPLRWKPSTSVPYDYPAVLGRKLLINKNNLLIIFNEFVPNFCDFQMNWCSSFIFDFSL